MMIKKNGQADCTLRILHFPSTLPADKRDAFLKRYGATNTKTIFKSDKYSATFADFPNKDIAENVFLQLHQLKIKGRHLCVEFAKNPAPPADDSQNVQVTSQEKDDRSSQLNHQKFLRKLNSWSGGNVFSQPPPPNLWYKYPSANREILQRICTHLLEDVAFYNQVIQVIFFCLLIKSLVFLSAFFSGNNYDDWSRCTESNGLCFSGTALDEQDEFATSFWGIGSWAERCWKKSRVFDRTGLSETKIIWDYKIQSISFSRKIVFAEFSIFWVMYFGEIICVQFFIFIFQDSVFLIQICRL